MKSIALLFLLTACASAGSIIDRKIHTQSVDVSSGVAQVLVSTTTGLGRRRILSIANRGAMSVWVGSSTATSPTTGYEIAPSTGGIKSILTLPAGGGVRVYGVADDGIGTGTINIRILQGE